MKRRILSLIICIVLLCPVGASALTPLEPEREASLTLCYRKESTAFPDLPISIYRVAEAFPDGSFQLIAPFSSYPVDIHGIMAQAQWHTVAETLYSCIVAEQVAPDRTQLTDGTGSVCFAGLKTGLYFVQEVVVDNQTGTYVFNQFLVYVPTPQTDGTYIYEVAANPKCTAFVPKTQYTVTKLWQDSGNQTARPAAVTVDIYKDGALFDTQSLNPDNNWSYTWYVSEHDPGVWTVAERDVPDGYKVTIQQTGSSFSIINAYPTVPDLPQTGDRFSPLLWILLMCISGAMLLILGLSRRRRK